MEDARQFHSYHSGTHDAQMLGQGGDGKNIGGVDERLLVGLLQRQHLGHRACGNDDEGGGDGIAVDLYGVVVGKVRLTLNHLYLGCCHQRGNTLTQLLYHLIFVCHHLLQVHGG